MYYFNADARDGGASNVSACNTCCCHPIYLRPGELGMVQVNYAPWVLPIAPPGLIPGGTEYTVEYDGAACASGVIDTFLPPTNINYEAVTPINTNLAIDISDNAEPATNAFQFALVPLSGPTRGTISQAAAGSPLVAYDPATGFTGYDYFSYKMTDAQGRSIVRSVRVSVGVHNDLPDVARMSLTPFIDLSRVKINQQLFTLQFPIQMPVSARPCDNWRVTLQQAAMDCERNLYRHQMCFDLSSKNC